MIYNQKWVEDVLILIFSNPSLRLRLGKMAFRTNALLLKEKIDWLTDWLIGDCWAQRGAPCLLRHPPTGPFRVLDFHRSDRFTCLKEQDGAARIWAENNMLCCSSHIEQGVPPSSCAGFIREPERPGCSRRDEVSVVLLLNRRCLVLLEVSDSLSLSDKCESKFNAAVRITET